MTTLAIDIGGTKLAAALVDDALNLVARRELPTPASKTPDALHTALQTLVEPAFPSRHAGGHRLNRDYSRWRAAGD